MSGCRAYAQAHSHKFHAIITKTWPAVHMDWLHSLLSQGTVSYQQIINQMAVSSLHGCEYYLIRCNVHMGNIWRKWVAQIWNSSLQRAAWIPQWSRRNDSAAHHNRTRQQLSQSAFGTDTSRSPSRPPPRLPDETQSQASLTISCSTHWGGSVLIPAA